MRKTLFPPSKQTNATGVILSGMGLDGTLGLRAIEAGRARENSPSAASTHRRKKP